MARVKRLRFAELEKMANAVDGQCGEPNWFDQAFGRERRVVMELGCGRGEYTLAWARSRPDIGVLGVDRNGARLWKGAATALEEGLTNARFLRTPIEYLEDHVPAGRVSEIWIPFPTRCPRIGRPGTGFCRPSFSNAIVGCYDPRRYPPKDGSRRHGGFRRTGSACWGRRVFVGSGSFVGNGAEASAIETTYEKRYRGEGRTIYDRTFCLD